MKVCYVFQDKYPWDIRVEKIMDSIAGKNAEGHILSKNNGLMPSLEKLKDNLFVHRLPSFSMYWLTFLVNFPAFFSPFWIRNMYRLVKGIGIDILIVRELPLAPAALLVGKMVGCPVLMDMAENYPEMIRDNWNYTGPKPLDYIIRNPLALEYLEKWVVPWMDGVLVVSSYSRDRVVRLGVDPEHIWIVSNTPKIDSFSGGKTLESKIAKEVRDCSSFIMTYIGGLEEHRGLDMVIKALPEILKKIPDATFVIVGAGSAEGKLRSLAESMGVLGNVRFTGWIDNQYVPSIIKASDICIVPHYVTEHINTTVPNKIFDYMLQGKPVVATNSLALKEIVFSSDCGKIYVHDDCIDLARKLLELESPEIREKYGENGREAVFRKYNWNVDEDNLFSALRALSSACQM